MLLGRDYTRINTMFIGVHGTVSITVGQRLPKLLSGGFGAIPNGVSHNLASSTAHGYP